MSVWLLFSPYGRSDFWWCVCVCQFVACMCMCCVFGWVWVCVCHLCTVDNVFVCTACFCPLWDWEFVVSWPSQCVSFMCVRTRVCVGGCWCLLQLSVCTTPGVSMVYYCVLMHGLCRKVWVCVMAVCVCGQALHLDCGSFRRSARFNRRCCTKHWMYFFSRGYCYLILFCDLSPMYMFVTCFSMQCTSALQECSFVFLSLVRV